jgi:hypothetical protein
MTWRETPVSEQENALNLWTPPRPGSESVRNLLFAIWAAAIVSISAKTAHSFTHPLTLIDLAIVEHGWTTGLNCVGLIHVDPVYVKEEPDFRVNMVDTDPRLDPVKCFDGRRVVNGTRPGPKVAGWLLITLQSALAMMGITLSDDWVRNLVGPNGPIKFIPWCHIDTHSSKNHHDPFLNPNVLTSWCGASDKQHTILRNFRDHSGDIGKVVASVMWPLFDQKVYDWLVQKMQIPSHDPRVVVESLNKNDDPDDVDVLSAWGDDAVNHDHHESWMVINWVPMTTIDNSRIDDPRKQQFCLDAWVLLDLAHEYYPDDEEKRIEFLHSLFAYQVSTYYTLTDWSQRVAFVKPKTPIFRLPETFKLSSIFQ